jgi:hypothetical protein
MKANIELHVHPFLNRNALTDVVKAMDKTNLDILALESLDCSLFPYVVGEAKKAYPASTNDSAGIKLPNGKYLLNAREYNTRENFHILTVGYSLKEATPQTEIRKIIDEGLNHDALVLLDHPYADNGKTRTAGHISEKMEQELEKICKEYSGQIALEWNAYCVPWVRWFLKASLNILGHKTLYHDINKKAEELSEKMEEQGYNLPLLADTDLHARNKRLLKAMGTSRFITDVEGECASDIVSSMKENIFEGNYKNIKKTINIFHLLEAYCLPVLLPKYFKKPRA